MNTISLFVSAAHGSQWTVWDHRRGLQLGRRKYSCRLWVCAKNQTKQKNPRVCVCLRIPGYAGPYFLVEPGTLWPQWLDLTGR